MTGIDFRKKLNIKINQKNTIKSKIRDIKKEIKLAEKEKEEYEQAQLMIQEAALLTQKQLQYHVSELVTLAIQSVFDDPYEFEVEFVTKRNQTEVDLWFVKNGERFEPISASGGGVVDIASLALRVSLLLIRNPESRKILILDEPMRFVSEVYQRKASEMLKMLSSKLGIQIIMTTHIDALVDEADRVFEVTQKKGKSRIAIIGE